MPGRELDELFRAWREEPAPPSLAPGRDERAGSAAVAAALRRVADRRRRAARLRKVVMALALAAGLTGLGVGAWFELGQASFLAQGAPSVVVAAREGDVSITDDVGRVVDASLALSEGYGVRTEQGRARLAFPSGASAEVANKSALKLTRAREREALFLASGGVDVEVPKLDAKRGFSVETPDALVTVHGTRFKVLVDSTAEGPRTRVQVTRGIVSVQKGGHEVFLNAGQEWPLADAAATTAEAPMTGAQRADAAAEAIEHDEASAAGDSDERSSVTPPREEQPEARLASERSSGAQSKSRALTRHELADQNRLFRRAMTAKKQGDSATALRELATIVRRYPGSPLIQEVRVERLRIWRSLGRSDLAAGEAKRYLREFPHGYAAAEAEQSISETP
jgi:hypothetical protein